MYNTPMSYKEKPKWSSIAKSRMKEMGFRYKDLTPPLGVTTESAVGHYFNGRRELDAGQLSNLAKKLELTTDQLLGEADITEYPAYNDLPQIYEQGRTNFAPVNTNQTLIPLISWVQAGDWVEPVDPFQPGYADEWYPCPVPSDPYRSFVLIVQGDSMDSGSADGYRDGEMIFVDPTQDAGHNDDVIVKNGKGEVTFKRLVQSGTKAYLKPLNPNWPDKIIPLDEHAVIVGRVIFSGKKR